MLSTIGPTGRWLGVPHYAPTFEEVPLLKGGQKEPNLEK